jgi:protocatechuate 3,4-dioxygenase beta subunit
VVRKDISKSFGDASGVAEGLPATLEMRLLDVSGGGTALAGAAVYLWHCDREGRYSLYDPAVASENYLRGVQVSDRDGRLTFQTIFPGAYAGRWPHTCWRNRSVIRRLRSSGSIDLRVRLMSERGGFAAA